MKKVTSQELTIIRNFIENSCGILLDASKSYLIESRLGPILSSEGVSSYMELVVKATKQKDSKLKHKIVDSITTNETYFFRDQKPFDLLSHKLIPDVLERQMTTKTPQVRIWSAASSTGQELYSIAMILKELLGNFYSHDLRIVGTDISQTALEIASRGIYGKIELSRGLSGARLKKHFSQYENVWRVNEDLRSIASFKHLNLLKAITTIPAQDIIFCRNVAFYFSKDNKQKLFQNLASKLLPGGSLVIGSTETLVGMDLPFKKQEYHGNVFYTL